MRYSEIAPIILSEIDFPTTANKAKVVLAKSGWKQLGKKGSYGSVFSKPDKDYVLKLFANEDVAYIDFINLVKTHPNEHFPKLGKLYKINKKYSAIRIEKLQPVTPEYKNEISTIISIVHILVLYSYDEMKFKMKDDEGLEWWSKYVDYLESNPSMKEAIFLLIPLIKKHVFDLYDNFLLRGNTIVITDPIRPRL